MVNPLGQSAPHEVKITGPLGFPLVRGLHRLLQAVAVACGRAGDRFWRGRGHSSWSSGGPQPPAAGDRREKNSRARWRIMLFEGLLQNVSHRVTGEVSGRHWIPGDRPDDLGIRGVRAQPWLRDVGSSEGAKRSTSGCDSRRMGLGSSSAIRKDFSS